jgi:flagellar basal body-associated protein FliL
MSSEIIVVLVLIALAVGGLVYMEIHSRRNVRSEDQQSQSKNSD